MSIRKETRGGKVVYVVDMRHADGNRREETFPTKKMAEERERDILVEKRFGICRARSKKLTVDDVFAHWFKECDRRCENTIRSGHDHSYREHLGPDCLYNYRTCYEKHVRPVLGKMKVIHPDLRKRCQDLLTEMSRKYAARQKLAHIVLKCAFDYAVDTDLMERSPFADKPLKSSIIKKPKAIPTMDELGRLLEAARELHYCERAYMRENRHAIVCLAVMCGLRRGEIAGLQWEGVDFIDSVILIRRSHARRAGLKTPKSKDGLRSVPMNTETREALGLIALRRAIRRPVTCS